MTLQQLTYFLAAIRHGSFSGAADALHLAQPSLSEQVRRLEDELGTPLFVRGARRLQLTPAGETLRPHAERTLAEAERARDSVREVRELQAGTASIGTFGAAPFYVMPDLVSAFVDRHPGVRVRVVGQNSTEVAEQVREGELEAALVVLPIDDRGLDVRAVLRDELLYVSADPERLKRPMTIERLAQAPLILYDARWGWNDPTRRQLRELALEAGVRIEPRIEVEDLDVALELAQQGYGDTTSTRAVVGSPRFPEGLGWVGFARPVHDTIAFITRRDATLSQGTRELMRIAEAQLAELERRGAERVG